MTMDKFERQQQLDVEKWVDSENKGYDTCGSYPYCAACDKSAENPCATAEEKASAKKPAKKAAKKPAAKKSKKTA